MVSFNKRVLLTGAGFSKNYGGFLAKTFRDHLLSEQLVQESPLLKMFVGEKNETFETVLGLLQSRAVPFTLIDQARDDYWHLREAVYNVFSDMNEVIRKAIGATNPKFNRHRINRFISKFAPIGMQAGYVFTLNQDMVLEHTYAMPDQSLMPYLPGIQQHNNYFKDSLRYIPLKELTVRVDEDGLFASIPYPNTLNIVKLHGSFNWESEGPQWKSADKKRLMVIGDNKSDAVSRSRLLSSYMNVFEQVLNAGDVRLFIIGYSFGDEHINRIIEQAARKSKLSVFVMDARSYDAMYDVMKEVSHGRIIGYIDEPFSEIFSHDDTDATPFDKRIRRFFEDS